MNLKQTQSIYKFNNLPTPMPPAKYIINKFRNN